ncbi:MAG: TonB-dependent receptor plug domain-containing protein [Pseudomonadales bacterium]|nr:TonB-dependent receptor plug domain-containing protein [Pseudomonadales bacterium]
MNHKMGVSYFAIVLGLGNFCVDASAEIEEVVVKGRLQSAAQALANERMNEGSVTDLLGEEMISRTGDSTVAAALRRVSGLSLVGGKFIYIRGLGERYSSTTLNHATIPSPDLSRNVIPLDIFPTSIVNSLSVQKSYSADRSAAFGAGLIDIRTKGIPDSFTYSVELTGGYNSESTGDLLSYQGGNDDVWGKDDGTRALSNNITQSIQRFKGALDTQSILNALRKEGDTNATFADAQALNRSLALDLNRDISLKALSKSPDWGVRGNIGNNFYLSDDWETGFLVSGGYGSKTRNTSAIARDFSFPEQRFEKESETTRSVDVNASINLGLRYTDDHEIAAMSLFIRSTDDEVAVIDFFNENREKSDGIGFSDTRIKFEERKMVVNQVNGTHYLGESTRSLIPWVSLDWLPEKFQVNWQYSKSNAATSIPNEVKLSSVTKTEPLTGVVLASNIVIDSAAADYRFTDLDDEVIHYSWAFILPIETANATLELSGGAGHMQKIRTYRQSQFSLGALRVSSLDVLSGGFSDVFSDANILSDENEFLFDLTGTNNQSYIAVNIVDSAFGKLDWTLNDTWRVSAGVRWESYIQVALDWNIYGYSVTSPQISNDLEVLKNSTFTSDEYYPAVALTYMTDWWAEVFQLRFAWSETVIRPDLREITDASYIDPRTGYLTDGNPSVKPADMVNFDLRAEWFFADDATFSVTGFYKEIDNPIEFFESAASDTNRAREIVNAASGELYGIEVEGMKNLNFLGEFGESFFVQSNFTIQETELVAGEEADAPTNSVRRLAGASDYVINFLVGFDSLNGEHSATLAYNIFGERLFSAGRNGAPDSFEQPFQSLDLTYSWYPSETIKLKLSAKNLLNDAVVIKREGVNVFEEYPGISSSMTFVWAL